ncbi:MAG: hypothetical protein WCP24_00005 [bacterium]
MALSEERLGQIAVMVLKHKLLKDGIHVSPKGVKQEAIDAAKAFGIPVAEVTEFLKIGLEYVFAETAKTLDELAKRSA